MATTIPMKHDYIISLGCEGYALLLKATKEAHKVIVDMNSLRGIIDVDLDFSGATTALGVAATDLAAVTAATTGDLALAAGVWTEEVKHIRADATEKEAHEYLVDGEARLNKFNKGRNVPDQYVLYAQAAMDMAKRWAEKRQDFLTAAQRRIDAAGVATQEAAQWIAAQNVRVQAAMQYVGNITQGVQATQMYRQDGLERLGRFKEELKRLEQLSHSRQKSQILLSNPWLED